MKECVRRKRILQLTLLSLALLCFLYAVLNSGQPSSSAILVGHQLWEEYSRDGVIWYPLSGEERFSAMDGALRLRGRFPMDVEDGFFYYYLDHIEATLLINGECVDRKTLPDRDGDRGRLTRSMCGRMWGSAHFEGLREGDLIEVHLSGEHAFGNGDAYHGFLEHFYISPSTEIMAHHLRPFGLPFRLLGSAIFVIAVMMAAAAVAGRFLGIPTGDRLLSFGILSMAVSGYLVLDTIDLAFWSELVAFNTYGWQLCMMLSVHWMADWTASGIEGRSGKAARVLAGISAAVNVLLIGVSLFGGVLIYDTLLWWCLLQWIVVPGLLICALLQLRESPRGCRAQQGLTVFLLVSLLVDLLGVGSSVYSRGNFTKLSFLILFIYHIVNMVKTIIANQCASLRERELEDSRVTLMLSQIRPHFLYNVMTSIYQLCEEDPGGAQQAIGSFSKYLRGNMGSLDKREPVPFQEELVHVETYLDLERMRYGSRLKTIYHIETERFRIPALTVQPLVENAVKHGLGKKKTGGTLTISAREEPEAFLVTVSDDGVGFDTGCPPEDDRPHVGIRGVRGRLQAMCGGTMEIKSVPGQGTEVVIVVPREGNEL